MKRLAIAVLLLATVPILGPSQVKDRVALPPKEAPPEFVGDGCTWFPDGDYADCCLAHDRDYYRGGTKEERRASDKRLAQCVRAKGHKYLSKIMFLGVRIGGVSWMPTPFRWGFGQDKKKNK